MKNEALTSPGGFRDYLPEEAAQRRGMTGKAERVFVRFGFVPLETPAVEHTELIAGEEGFAKELMELDGGGLVLRPEHTLPLARVMATNPGLKKPAKLYRIGLAWRGERQQAGRFKEFMQADADIVGSKSVLADVEILALTYALIKELGVANAVIYINHRKLLDGLLKLLKVPKAEQGNVLRVLDKTEKIGWDGVLKELKKAGVGMKEARVMKSFVTASGKPGSVLQKLQELLKGNADGEAALAELTEIVGYLDTLKVPGRTWRIVPGIIRGQGYYTGIMLEVFVKGHEDVGSVMAGGRYDKMVGSIGGADMPAVGVSVGIDRLLAAGVGAENKLPQGVLVVSDETTVRDGLMFADELRAAGVSAAPYLGKDKTIKGKLSYAAASGARIVAIIGAEEKKNGTVTIRDMEARSQETCPRAEARARVKKRVL